MIQYGHRSDLSSEIDTKSYPCIIYTEHKVNWRGFLYHSYQCFEVLKCDCHITDTAMNYTSQLCSIIREVAMVLLISSRLTRIAMTPPLLAAVLNSKLLSLIITRPPT